MAIPEFISILRDIRDIKYAQISAWYNSLFPHIGNIDAVGLNINNVNAVAVNESNINTVADDLLEPVSEINTVAGNITNVNTVANNTENINAVVANSININSVATNMTDVNVVASEKNNIDLLSYTITEGLLFHDVYLGAHNTPPVLNNVGEPLIEGNLYFNTVVDMMYVYGSLGWVITTSSVNGTSERHVYTATNGQTIFAVTYDSGYLDVFLNGSKLQNGVDFTATGGTFITLTSPASAGDIIDIVAFGVFSMVDSASVAYTVETVDDLVSVPSGYKTAIVKDLNRGGTFIWSSTGTANDGTVFAGATGYWNRQYSGAVNVKWFGAVGDGIADDTEAFNKVKNYSSIVIPNGIYKLTSQILFNSADYYDIVGLGLVQLFTDNGLSFPNNIICKLSNFQIIGNNGSAPSIDTGTIGLLVGFNRYSSCDSISVKGFSIGVKFLSNKFSIAFNNCYIAHNRSGWMLQNANNNIIWNNCTTEYNIDGYDIGYSLGGATYNNIINGGAIQFNSAAGINLLNAAQMSVNCYFEQNTSYHINANNSVVNGTVLMYGASNMNNAINLVASKINIDGKSFGHNSYTINGDSNSIVISSISSVDIGAMTNSSPQTLGTKIDTTPEHTFQYSKIIDSQWFRTDSAGNKIRLYSSGQIEATVGASDPTFNIANGVQLLLGTVKVYRKNGTPEGSLTANVGSVCLRTDGGAGTTLYIKESGTGNTGWAAK